MSERQIRYLLRCNQCNKETRIEQSQAGLAIPCACGATIEAPTIRGLAKLKQVELRPDVAATNAPWGRRQQLFAVSGVLFAASALFFVLLQVFAPAPPNAEQLFKSTANRQPRDAWSEWMELQNWGPEFDPRSALGKSISTAAENHAIAAQTHRRSGYLTAAVFVVGLLVGSAALLMPPPRKPAR